MVDVFEQPVGERLLEKFSHLTRDNSVSDSAGFSEGGEMGGNGLENKADKFDLVAEVDHRIFAAAMTTRFHGTRVSEAINYHLSAGGNRTRARITYRFGKSLGLEDNQSLPLAVASEAVHNASLILDDLQDRDAERRGQPAVWSAFGPEVASLASQLLVSAGFAALADPCFALSSGDLVAIFHSRIASTIYGQEADLYPSARRDGKQPDFTAVTWSSYVRNAVAKSGGLLSLPIELPLIATDQAFAVHLARKMMGHFATAYQIIDDLADVARDENRTDMLSAPNAVISILEESDNAFSAKEAIRLASKQGQRELDLALDLARKVPGGCHKIISEEAQRLMLAAGEAIAHA